MNDALRTLPPAAPEFAVPAVPATARLQKRYVRPLSALERYSLVLHGAYRYHVDGILEGVGAIDAKALQAAVNRAAEANPAIRVRLSGILKWCQWRDSGKAPRVRVQPLSEWNGSSEQHATFLDEPLKARKAVADVLLVPCTDGRTRIVFRTLHAAIDGRGCIHWMSEVCRAMRGEPLLGSDAVLTDLDVQDRFADQIPPDSDIAPQNCLSVLAPEPGAAEGTGGPLRYLWRRVLIDRDVPQLLTKAAAWLAERARQRGPGEVGFTIPVDYRGFRIQEMGIGNLTGYLRLVVPEGASARSLMVQLGQRIKAYADCRSFPGIRGIVWLPVWWMLRGLKPKINSVLYTMTTALPTGGVVSMGSLKTTQFDWPGFTAENCYGIPGAVGKLNLIFVNYPTHVCISFASPAAFNHEGQFDALVRDFQNHFSSAGRTP